MTSRTGWLVFGLVLLAIAAGSAGWWGRGLLAPALDLALGRIELGQDVAGLGQDLGLVPQHVPGV